MNSSKYFCFLGKRNKKKKRNNLPLTTLSILLVIGFISYEEINQFTASKQKDDKQTLISTN